VKGIYLHPTFTDYLRRLLGKCTVGLVRCLLSKWKRITASVSHGFALGMSDKHCFT